MTQPNESTATIADRVQSGTETNQATGPDIVPFPDAWEPEDIFETSTSSARSKLYGLLQTGWKITRVDLYTDDRGKRIFGALRVDHPDEGKQVLPIRASRAVGMNPNVEIKALEAPRPLFALHALASSPHAPVIVVEGEKTAVAGQGLFPEHVVTTWSGGTGGVSHVDLRPLAGRDVTIWPDHDEAGLKAAEALGLRIAAAGASAVRIVMVPPNFPTKWDLADSVPEALDE